MRNYNYLLLIFFLLSACQMTSKGVFVEVKNVSLIYTRPEVLTNQDTLSRFETYCFINIDCKIKNPSMGKKEITFNNLIVKNYLFDMKMDYSNKEIFFYNYPFSLAFYPGRNSESIKAGDSISVCLQTPLIFHDKDFTINKADSVLEVIKEGRFSLVLNKHNDDNVIRKSNYITYNVVPISGKCFFPER